MVRNIAYVLCMMVSIGLSTNLMAGCSNKDNSDFDNTMNTTTEKDLFKAIQANNLPKVKEIVETSMVSLEVKNSKGETPLLLATYLKYNDIAFYLIDRGANVNAQDSILNSPFLYAGAEGNLALVKKALEHGADFTVFNRYNGTALIPAAEKGHLDVVALLVHTPNFPIDHVNRLGWTALMEAIVLSDGGAVHVAIVKELIKGGVDVNIPDHDGKTPLYHARANRYTAMVEALETAGAH